MIKKLNAKIEKMEQKKQTKVEKLSVIQAEIDEIDTDLKKLNTFKRDYEKLEKNSSDYLKSLGGKKNDKLVKKAA